ncbi:MAG: TIGR04283 family arsenosugar biosynthesis glycosyltransferase [Planctomycetota bacterium]
MAEAAEIGLGVSVVIPALNEAGQIEGCIRSAREAGATEVVVCDGGSSDETVAIAEACGAKVFTAEAGRAVQQNTGAAAAAGDVLLFLHADNRLSLGCLSQVAEAMRDTRVVYGGFRQEIIAAGLAYRVIERGNAARLRLAGLAYGDQGIFVRRAVFDEVGGFPEVPLMEDVRLMRKLAVHGRPVLLDGPIAVSARRWQRHGVVRQTLRNWSMLASHRLGVSPEMLARYYPRHG